MKGAIITVLVASLLLSVIFALIASTFHGFVKEATASNPELKKANSAKTWVSICIWISVVCALVAMGSAYIISKDNKLDST